MEQNALFIFGGTGTNVTDIQNIYQLRESDLGTKNIFLFPGIAAKPESTSPSHSSSSSISTRRPNSSNLSQLLLGYAKKDSEALNADIFSKIDSLDQPTLLKFMTHSRGALGLYGFLEEFSARLDNKETREKFKNISRISIDIHSPSNGILKKSKFFGKQAEKDFLNNILVEIADKIGHKIAIDVTFTTPKRDLLPVFPVDNISENFMNNYSDANSELDSPDDIRKSHTIDRLTTSNVVIASKIYTYGFSHSAAMKQSKYFEDFYASLRESDKEKVISPNSLERDKVKVFLKQMPKEEFEKNRDILLERERKVIQNLGKDEAQLSEKEEDQLRLLQEAYDGIAKNPVSKVFAKKGLKKDKPRADSGNSATTSNSSQDSTSENISKFDDLVKNGEKLVRDLDTIQNQLIQEEKKPKSKSKTTELVGERKRVLAKLKAHTKEVLEERSKLKKGKSPNKNYFQKIRRNKPSGNLADLSSTQQEIRQLTNHLRDIGDKKLSISANLSIARGEHIINKLNSIQAEIDTRYEISKNGKELDFLKPILNYQEELLKELQNNNKKCSKLITKIDKWVYDTNRTESLKGTNSPILIKRQELEKQIINRNAYIISMVQRDTRTKDTNRRNSPGLRKFMTAANALIRPSEKPVRQESKNNNHRNRKL